MALELHLEAKRRGLVGLRPDGPDRDRDRRVGNRGGRRGGRLVAGAAERLVVDGAAMGDLLWVEGQGSLIHPYYSAVTLGLYHGALPHVLVLCHKAGDTHIEELPEHPIPPLSELVELAERVALPVRPATVACVALNTMNLDDEAARQAVQEAEGETGLVADDPVRFGAGRLVDAVLERVPAAARG